MEFSTQQLQSIDEGELVSLTIGETECVIVRRDVLNLALVHDDVEAIRLGIKAAEEGRESTLAEVDAHIRKELGFPPRA